MTVTITKSRAKGEVLAPPSKSMAHRLLICGGLSEKSVISSVAFSKDISATLNCLKGLGARVEINGDTVTLGGLLEGNNNPCEIDCFESGSTLRFMIPLCLLSERKIILKGSQRLMERPLSVYEEICRNLGITFIKEENKLTLCGRLKGGEYSVRGDISSQFITGLLFALPLLDRDSKIKIIGKLESAPYIDLTLKALNDFGIEIKRVEDGFFIKGNQSYKGISTFVEGDYSNAAFLDAFNMLDGNVKVSGLKNDSLQGDKAYKEIFYDLNKGEKVFDLTDCPDLAPIAFAMAAVKGGAVFKGTKRLKIKESDRSLAMKTELKKFGINVNIYEDFVEIEKGTLKSPIENLCGHNDHRIVMALAVISSLVGGVIEGAEAVEKSFPNFFEKISSLGICVKENATS